MNDLLARLIAAGTPAELVAEVAMELGRAQGERDALERRRAAERANTASYRQRGGGQVPGWLRQEIYERDGYQCVDCGAVDRLEIDHIIPLAKGGDPVHPDNLQTLCRPCNARKRDRIRKSDNRGKLRTSEDSVDVTDATPFPSPSPSFPPDPPNNPTPAHTPGNNTRARKGTRLDEGWQPEPVIGKTAEMLENWPPGAVERELEKFRNYWLAKAGKDACKTSWQRTWINWLISADERIAKHGNQSANHRTGYSTSDGGRPSGWLG